MNLLKLKKLFRVDDPGPFAFIDSGLPMWVDGEPDWEGHFRGDRSLCVTPIGRENTCYWGALDIDAKKDAPPINHLGISEFIREHNIPLNIFYSKSGKGAHAYMFSNRPVPAVEFRAILRMYAIILKPWLNEKNGIEIFPKQDELFGDDNGSCIRPPYFGKACQPAFIGDPVVSDFISLPQCLIDLPEEGNRNNYLYHITNFLALSGVSNVKTLVSEINHSTEDPLDDDEVERTVASAMRQRTRKGAKFGLGCSSCPADRKKSCKFASQLKVKEVSSVVAVEIVHFLAEDPKIKLTADGKSLTFDLEEAFNNHLVRLQFLTKHRTPAIPLMKRGDWHNMMHNLLEEADHVEEVTHRDKGHFIMQKLRKWSRDFKPGVSALYSGTPVFISEEEVLVFPHDVYNWFVTTGIIGISREDINSTLESIGTPVVVNGSPVIKIPVNALDVKSPGLEIPIIADIDPAELVIETGKDGLAVVKNKEGIRIELTNAYIKDHPDIQRRILEATQTSVQVNY